VGDHAEPGFTVLAEGFDDAVVAVAVRLVGLEGCHKLGIYTRTGMHVNGYLYSHRKSIPRQTFRIYAFEYPNSMSRNDLTETGIGVLINSR
jgi:hypothetical protein